MTTARGPAGEDAVVLLQMGGPDTVDDLPDYLEAIFADANIIQLPRWMRPFQPALARRVARKRSVMMREKYGLIGGGSPLGRETEAQARALEAELARRGRPARVVVAMRYAAPRAEAALARVSDARRITLLTLYPHYSRATTGSSVEDFLDAARAAGFAGRMDLVRAWPTLPAYVALLNAQVEEALKRASRDADGPVHLLMSAHGIPQRYVTKGGDPYPTQVEATARLVGASALAAGYAGWRLGYQSKVGPVEWLRPYTDDVLPAMKAAGAASVVALPLGFVSDHIETLYDLDILYKGQAEALGLRYHRIPAFNDDPRFVAALADALDTLPREEARA